MSDAEDERNLQSLVRKWRETQAEPARRELMNELAGAIHALAKRTAKRCGVTPPDDDDVAQVVVLEMVEREYGISGVVRNNEVDNFPGYVVGTARHKAIDWHRQRQRLPFVPSLDDLGKDDALADPVAPDVEQNLEDVDLINCFENSLESDREKQVLAAMLREEEVEVTANRLRVSTRQIVRDRDKVRKKFRRHEANTVHPSSSSKNNEGGPV